MDKIDANEIRKIIVEELGALRYAEIKNVRENLNSEFIEKELEKFKKLKRTNMIRIVAFIVFVVLVGFRVHFEGGWFMYLYLCMGFLGAVAAGFDLGILHKRVTIYKILKKLSNVLKNVPGTSD